ncbi:hypothetical protein MRB53_034239 [Persea americana]|uniref:Uncharacterized protein n=1 Tax=Persea americana TaxID=3435 RepID=A0ACC2KY40_PERAE|nr:hypothetical protein MRB53_034239 [Persea americana]
MDSSKKPEETGCVQKRAVQSSASTKLWPNSSTPVIQMMIFIVFLVNYTFHNRHFCQALLQVTLILRFGR